MSFSKETGPSPNSWCWQPQNLGTNASSCNQERGTEVLLKKYRGTYVKRFAPRTAQAGTVRRTVRKWNLGLPLCQYPLLCISAGAEPMERALIHGALPTTPKYCGKHIQGHQPEAVAESPGNLPVSLAWEAPEEFEACTSFTFASPPHLLLLAHSQFHYWYYSPLQHSHYSKILSKQTWQEEEKQQGKTNKHLKIKARSFSNSLPSTKVGSSHCLVF